MIDLPTQGLLWNTEASHCETIFGISYCKSDKNYLASCSYDGTVRVWNSTTMKLAQINDTAFNTPQAKEEKKIIYSISWHPSEPKIALTTIHGHLIVYDALRGKYLSSITP